MYKTLLFASAILFAALLVPVNSSAKPVVDQSQHNSIVVYTQPGCEPCAELKAYFKANHIAASYINITKQIIIEKHITSTPTVYIDGKKVGGLEEIRRMAIDKLRN